MIFIAILIGCILGVILGMYAPIISYTYSSYLAIAVIAALDSVFGGIASVVNKRFDMKIFISNTFNTSNSIRTKVKCRYLSSCNCSFCR